MLIVSEMDAPHVRTVCSISRIGALLVASCIATSYAQSSDLDPANLVRQSVQNEVSSGNSRQRFRFKDEKRTPHLSQTKLIVEAKEATAGMIVKQDGRPLDPQQRQAEESRLENYVRNPEALTKKRKQEKEDAEHTERILRALPDAFLYQADGVEQGTQAVGRSGDQLVRLKFRPNPNYQPPTRVEQILTGMAGHVLVDVTEKRIAEIDGTLQKDVGFGWGILGHLDSGGRFLVQQADVGEHHWEITRLELSFTGKVLLFKKLDIRSSEIFSDFHPVPANLTFAQAVEFLKKEAAQSDAPQTAIRPANNGTQIKQQAEKACCER